MSWIGSAVGIGLSSVATIGANLDADRTRAQLNALSHDDPTYTQSPYAAKQFALAGNLLNARMPGAASQEQNIYGVQADQNANIDKNATDSATALSQKAAAAGQAGRSFSNLGTAEAQFGASAVQNYNQGAEAETQEAHNQYQDQVRQWQDSINLLLARNGIKQNEWQGVNSLGSSLSSMGSSFGGSSAGK